MNIKKITTLILSGSLLLAAVGIVPNRAHAIALQVGSSTAVGTNLELANLTKIMARSNTAIDARILSLNNLSTRIGEMKNVSASEKTNISNEVATNITGLTSLKTKIDADTQASVGLTDEKSIYGSFRIYALVIPQGYIEASADRVNTIVGMFGATSTKLQARITALQTAGKNVTTLQAALADLNAKTADATIQSATAQSTVATLTPDQGNQTQLQSNTNALKAARANIKVATTDLQTARADAKTIIQGLTALNVNTSASTSTSTNQ
jgi:hypothetical protein